MNKIIGSLSLLFLAASIHAQDIDPLGADCLAQSSVRERRFCLNKKLATPEAVLEASITGHPERALLAESFAAAAAKAIAYADQQNKGVKPKKELNADLEAALKATEELQRSSGEWLIFSRITWYVAAVMLRNSGSNNSDMLIMSNPRECRNSIISALNQRRTQPTLVSCRMLDNPLTRSMQVHSY